MNNENYPPNTGQPEDDQAKTESGHAIPDHLMPEEDAHPPAQDVTELNEKILRLAAELENTRRRAERDKVEAGKYAIANFARDLLSVADNFERALQVAPEGGDVDPETVSGMVTGVRMTEAELLRTLERHGVKKIDPKGEKFDPHIHQAVAQAPAATIPQGFVAEVAQPGFVLGERVLRAAMVVVSTGGEQADDQPTAGDGGALGVDTRA